MLNFVKSLTQNNKTAIILALDCVLICAALVFAFMAQALPGALTDNVISYLPVLPYLLVASVGFSWWLGVCTTRLNAYESRAIGQTAVFAGFLTMTSTTLANVTVLGLPLGFHFVFGASFFLFAVISRVMLLQLVLTIYRRSEPHCRVLIYGAGTTGTQLVSALRSHKSIRAVAFVDDNKSLQGLSVAGLPVFSPLHISDVVRDKKIDRVLLAIPSLAQPKRLLIARNIQKMGLEVQTLPSFAQLVGEEELLDKLKPVHAQSILGREELSGMLDSELECYKGRVIMVSGAGGSIGSELCRQILDRKPAKIVMFDLSELALYNIDMEMRQSVEDTDVELVSVLGSITEARQVRKVLQEHAVQVVLHAAAYKHVPLVESNPLSGLVNNVFGTQTLAQEAAKAGVERFILISTDKAVRPTSIMGASKRLAELVVQDMARRFSAGQGPIFSMVRFGNVIGSSGSVVPLFQEQLNRGGPVTVTDPKVYRYFMTVQEAVKLVLQSGALAKGGEVFVLDMGKPVSILHLARQVIENSGFTVRDDAHPDGDVEIVFTGLRPGEKMVEELTLTKQFVATDHPKIFCVNEAGLAEIEISSALRQLREAFLSGNESFARSVVMKWVESPLSTARGADELETGKVAIAGE